jgi:putative ABC transport system ATP-binding protein
MINGISLANNSEKNQPMIKTNQLTKVFRTDEIETTALNKVNFDVAKGEFVAVMGPSGCGKSTLLNIVGLLDNPSDGQYFFNGIDVSKFRESQRTGMRKGNIGFVFQSFNLIDELTVYENVELPLLYLKIRGSERRKKVNSILERMKISHRSKHFPQQLSGGQQQRVAIARALINNPSLVLADEPTGNLDSRTSVEIMEIFQRLSKERNLTILLVTHEPDIARYANRVVLFRDGKVRRDEPVEDRADAADVLKTLPVIDEDEEEET